jgi:hypothetical protein
MDQSGSNIEALAALAKKFSWASLVVFLASEGVGMPLTIAGGEALADQKWSAAAIGFGFGLPLMGLGFTFPLFKGKLGDVARERIIRSATLWLPIAILLAFIYVVGPNILARVGPRNLESSLDAAAQISTPSLINGHELDNARKAIIPIPSANFDPLKQFAWTDANAEETEIEVTPAFLMSLYRGKTKIQANAEASMYLGKRIRMHGKVRDVTTPGNGTIVVFLETTDGTQISMTFTGEEGKFVSIYAIDQNIDSMCIVHEVGNYSVSLFPCKLEKSQG